MKPRPRITAKRAALACLGAGVLLICANAGSALIGNTVLNRGAGSGEMSEAEMQRGLERYTNCMEQADCDLRLPVLLNYDPDQPGGAPVPRQPDEIAADAAETPAEADPQGHTDIPRLPPEKFVGENL